MSEVKVFQLTIHPERKVASYGMGYPIPRVQALRPGETEYRVWGESIEGFEPIEGHRYVIEVEERPRPPPLPMDCSSVLYRLVRVISDEVV